MNKLIFISLVLVGCGGGSFDTVGAAGDAGEAGSAGSITGGAGNGGGDAGNSGSGIAGAGSGAAGSAGAPTTCEGLAESDWGTPKNYNFIYCNVDGVHKFNGCPSCPSCPSDSCKITSGEYDGYTCNFSVKVISAGSVNLVGNETSEEFLTTKNCKKLPNDGEDLYICPDEDGVYGNVVYGGGGQPENVKYLCTNKLL